MKTGSSKRSTTRAPPPGGFLARPRPPPTGAPVGGLRGGGTRRSTGPEEAAQVGHHQDVEDLAIVGEVPRAKGVGGILLHVEVVVEDRGELWARIRAQSLRAAAPLPRPAARKCHFRPFVRSPTAAVLCSNLAPAAKKKRSGPHHLWRRKSAQSDAPSRTAEGSPAGVETAFLKGCCPSPAVCGEGVAQGCGQPPFRLEPKPRQDKTRQDRTRQDKTRQDKTRQDKTRQDMT